MTDHGRRWGPGARRVGVLAVAVVVGSAGVVATASGSDEIGRDTSGSMDLPSGEYHHSLGEMEYRTIYETRSTWARQTVDPEPGLRDLLLRIDEAVYHIDTAAAHVLVLGPAEDLVPEGFILSPTFLTNLASEKRTDPPATAEGVAVARPGAVSVPERLTVGGSTYEVHGFDDDPATTVAEVFRGVLSQPGAEILELDDAPRAPLEPGPHGGDPDD